MFLIQAKGKQYELKTPADGGAEAVAKPERAVVTGKGSDVDGTAKPLTGAEQVPPQGAETSGRAAPPPDAGKPAKTAEKKPESAAGGRILAPEPQPAAGPNVGALLNECDTHFQANRLTSGDGGNALSCYKGVFIKSCG